MNVIVSNKYQSLLSSLNIDVIKSINGEFTVEELVSQFQSFYFNKRIAFFVQYCCRKKNRKRF